MTSVDEPVRTARQESPRKRRKDSNQRAHHFLHTAKLLDTCNAGQQLLFLEHSWTVARALKVITVVEVMSTLRLLPTSRLDHIAIQFVDDIVPDGNIAQELGDRRIFSAPLIIKPDLEDLQDGEDSPEPTFLGWIDITTMLQAFIKGNPPNSDNLGTGKPFDCQGAEVYLFLCRAPAGA